MDFPFSLGKDFSADIKIANGKIQVMLEFEGVDAAIDALKVGKPEWLQMVLDVVKVKVDAP